MTDTSKAKSGSPKGFPRGELVEILSDLQKKIESLEDEVQALRRREVPEGPDALFRREDAAEVLGISVSTLDDMEDAGEIQAVRIRGRVLYAPETLQAYIRRRAGGDGR